MTSDGTAERDARVRAGASLRNLGHAFVGREMSVEQIDQLADSVDEIADQLWPGQRRYRTVGDLQFPSQGIPEGRMDPDYSDRPVSGAASPWGLDVDLRRDPDRIVASLVLRSAHEGAPGRAHGGIVAALFDDVMGFVLGMIKQPGFTGELCVRYTAPTPLFRTLECRAWPDGRDGRKIKILGELVDVEADVTCATAHATFIAVEGYGGMTAARPMPNAEARD